MFVIIGQMVGERIVVVILDDESVVSVCVFVEISVDVSADVGSLLVEVILLQIAFKWVDCLIDIGCNTCS